MYGCEIIVRRECYMILIGKYSVGSFIWKVSLLKNIGNKIIGIIKYIRIGGFEKKN